MKFPVVLTFVSLVAATSAQEGFITNGSPARPGQFPYQAAVEVTRLNGRGMSCGGSLIDHQWVLTAAHCTIDASSVRVSLGSIIRNGGLSHIVARRNIINHPQYNGGNLHNDIALIRIPFTRYTRNILRVILPRIANTYPDFAGRIAIASGWGRISDSNRASTNELRWARMPIISNRECTDFGTLLPSQLCVSTRGAISTCQGDSGGPLVLQGINGLLVGITSFVGPSCTANLPAGFTRVTSFLPWIRDVTGLRL